MSYNFIALLGADDPEMRAIKSVLEINKIKTVFATKNGQRVHPGNAYDADAPEVPSGMGIIVIECGWNGMSDVIVIDHHRPGDPGYGKDCSQYWTASSLGQIYELLGLPRNEEASLVAAIDHCAADAFQGRCPGVDAESARLTRRRQIDESFPDLTSADRERMLSPIMTALGFAGLATITMGASHAVLDFASPNVAGFEPTSVGVLDPGYSYQYLMLQQIWLEKFSEQYDGMIFLHRDVSGGPEKCVFNGKPETVRAFIEDWAPRRGLVRIYGNPERGYAGGYIEPRATPQATSPGRIKRLFSGVTRLIAAPRG